MGRPKRYPHQILIDEEDIDIDYLPSDIQKAIVIFEKGDKKDAGYNEALDPTSEEIASDIRDWLDKELKDENCPCGDPDIKAVFVLFYEEGIDLVTAKDLKEAGFDTKQLKRRGQAKKEVEVGDYKLKKQGKGKNEKYKIEEKDEVEVAAEEAVDE